MVNSIIYIGKMMKKNDPNKSLGDILHFSVYKKMYCVSKSTFFQYLRIPGSNLG